MIHSLLLIFNIFCLYVICSFLIFMSFQLQEHIIWCNIFFEKLILSQSLIWKYYFHSLGYFRVCTGYFRVHTWYFWVRSLKIWAHTLCWFLLDSKDWYSWQWYRRNNSWCIQLNFTFIHNFWHFKQQQSFFHMHFFISSHSEEKILT